MTASCSCVVCVERKIRGGSKQGKGSSSPILTKALTYGSMHSRIQVSMYMVTTTYYEHWHCEIYKQLFMGFSFKH